MDEIIRYLRDNRQRHERELLDFVSIPSVSAKSEHDLDIGRAADWLVARMLAAGMQTAEVIGTGGHPVVVGEWRGAPDRPTLLVYGHYDVQPAEPLEEWTSPPFEPEIREDRLYGRGAGDDKGQLFLYLRAVEAHVAITGKLPVNLVFLVEGEEEVGSPNLEPFLIEHRDRFRCDAVLISDTGMISPGTPSITIGLRGMAYLEIRVTGPATDLHSGIYGGPVVNPANALARIIAGLHDEEGRVTIPGFYDGVPELDQAERTRMAALPFSEADFGAEVGVRDFGGEKGFTVLERIWTRPTLDVNGLLSGYTGEGAKTVLPARAMAKVSMRLVPGQSARDIARKFTDHVVSVAPRGVSLEVVWLHGGEPWHADPHHLIFEAAGTALQASFGKPPVLIREGGSIPIVHSFQQTLDVPVVLVGFLLPGANAHAPNEWFSMDNFARGSETIARLLLEAASLRSEA